MRGQRSSGIAGVVVTRAPRDEFVHSPSQFFFRPHSLPHEDGRQGAPAWAVSKSDASMIQRSIRGSKLPAAPGFWRARLAPPSSPTSPTPPTQRFVRIRRATRTRPPHCQHAALGRAPFSFKHRRSVAEGRSCLYAVSRQPEMTPAQPAARLGSCRNTHLHRAYPFPALGPSPSALGAGSSN